MATKFSFSFGSQADADEICARSTIERSEPLGRAYWLSDGCIPICSQGCTFFSALVTAGELRGKATMMVRLRNGGPAVRPPGLLPDGSYTSGRFVIEFAPRPLPTPPRPPTFIQWNESWLERLEIDLDDYNHFKSQDRRR